MGRHHENVINKIIAADNIRNQHSVKNKNTLKMMKKKVHDRTLLGCHLILEKFYYR